MSYRKQISYLELQENGQRIRSAGYARLESLDKEEILTVQLNEQESVSGNEIPLYLQRESGEQQLCTNWSVLRFLYYSLNQEAYIKYPFAIFWFSSLLCSGSTFFINLAGTPPQRV